MRKTGKEEPVVPISIDSNVSVKELVDSLGKANAFNAGRLYEASKVFETMLRGDALVFTSIAGALIPAGMGGLMCNMIRKGQIDVIVSTGANIYHDTHMALGRPFYKGSWDVDDVAMRKEGKDRVYDIYAKEKDMIELDDLLCGEIFPEITNLQSPSTAEFHYELGRQIKKKAEDASNSVLVQAYEHKVPIFCSSPGDSSIGMDLAKYNYFLNPERPIKIDVDRDVVQSTGLTLLVKSLGALILGGGSPKNFTLQTQPMLEQILGIKEWGLDYVIQFTVDTPQYGGLSGATPHEAISWGKIKPHMRDNLIVVYGDVTILLSLLACSSSEIIRKPKCLIDSLGEAEETLLREFHKKGLSSPKK